MRRQDLEVESSLELGYLIVVIYVLQRVLPAVAPSVSLVAWVHFVEPSSRSSLPLSYPHITRLRPLPGLHISGTPLLHHLTASSTPVDPRTRVDTLHTLSSLSPLPPHPQDALRP